MNHKYSCRLKTRYAHLFHNKFFHTSFPFTSSREEGGAVPWYIQLAHICSSAFALHFGHLPSVKIPENTCQVLPRSCNSSWPYFLDHLRHTRAFSPSTQTVFKPIFRLYSLEDFKQSFSTPIIPPNS